MIVLTAIASNSIVYRSKLISFVIYFFIKSVDKLNESNINFLEFNEGESSFILGEKNVVRI